jgi:hypothetical protein
MLAPFVRTASRTARRQVFAARLSTNTDDVDGALRAVLENVKSKIHSAQLANQAGASNEEEPVPGVKTPGPKLRLEFTCTYGGCELPAGDEAGKRVVKTISKNSYETGVVLVYCPCDKMHMIADNLCWFDDEPSNIETIMTAREEEVAALCKEGIMDIS